MHPCQFRLGIKRIDLRRASVGKEMDDPFCAARKVTGFRREGGYKYRLGMSTGIQLPKYSCEADHSKSGATAGEELSSGKVGIR